MAGKVLAFVAARGHGKTSRMRSFVNELRVGFTAYDFHGDWRQGSPDLSPKGRAAFVDKTMKADNHCFIYEDATGFFSTAGVGDTMLNAMARSRNHNVIILLAFHSLRKLPLDIIDLCDGIVLGHTADNPAAIKRKFGEWPKITDAIDITRQNVCDCGVNGRASVIPNPCTCGKRYYSTFIPIP